MDFYPPMHQLNSSQWTDALTRDNEMCTFSTAINQNLKSDKSSSQMHASEDRCFAYKLKDDTIFAYGLLDGFSGDAAVNLLELSLISSIYLDYLENLESKTDDEIYRIIDAEFRRCEYELRMNVIDDIAVRTSLTQCIRDGEVRRNSIEYDETKKNILRLDYKLNSGAFALLALLIGNRLFVTSLGTSRCILVSLVNNCYQETRLTADHSIINESECMRLKNMRAKVSPCEHDTLTETRIKYTRCFGNFKIKYFYNEYDHFKDCNESPIIYEPDHLTESVVIDKNALFMVMFTESIMNVLVDTGAERDKVNETVITIVINSIRESETLKEAIETAVSALKRLFEDNHSIHNLKHEDLTILVRIFTDFNTLKQKISESEVEEVTNPPPQPPDELVDGLVVPYVDFGVYHECIDGDQELKKIFDAYAIDLSGLSKDFGDSVYL